MSGPLGWRAAFAAELAAILGDAIDIAPTQALAQPVQRPLLLISLPRIAAPTVACPARSGQFELWIVTPMIDQDGNADDDVDQACAAVLDALDSLPVTSWSTADRTVWLDRQPAYKIACERTPRT
jgi:hypothetical protein